MLRKNILANYISQAYVTVIGILILPLYIKYMGAEAYGLIGFFTLLQAWFGLLDLGLSPTISRESARYQCGSLAPLPFIQLYRSLSIIFALIAVFGAGILLATSEYITAKWLTFETLNKVDVLLAVQIMAISISLRWMGGLYRGIITGAELIVWLSIFNIVVATLRFIGVFISMYVFGFNALIFFLHQLAVAILELIFLFFKSNTTLPNVNSLPNVIGWSFKPVRKILKFAMTIAFTSSIWVLATQTDKLILSGILPLADYGYFTLAVLVASAIMVTSGPISTALMPRMVRLWAAGNIADLLEIYRKSTQLVSIISGAVTVTFVFAAEPMLFAWTGDTIIASKAAPILQLYAIGNGFLVLAAFPYYLQYAIGNLKYHFIGNVIILTVLIPSIIFSANAYGGIGAAWVWVSLNMFMFVIWVGFVHWKLFPGLHFTWLFNDILAVFIPMFLISYILSNIQIAQLDRLESLLFTILFGCIFLFVAVLSSSAARVFLCKRFKNRYLC
ncbi:oligosaccharide flippase family protein [Shewanella xiamenensis]|uniref:oligosaccharide flippase family protein n=1 Tax=Shewanella xiamenensis TaxID=332186 RepID=UPI00313B9143